MRSSASAVQICPWCQYPTQPIWVHGHAQCQHCRINIDPCCGGDEIIPSGGDPDEGAILIGAVADT